jgi:hypothetical protein
VALHPARKAHPEVQHSGRAGQGDQPGEGSEVLLAVAALEHVGGEELVQRDAAGQERQVPVVHAVGQDDDAQRHVLVGQRTDVGDAGIDVADLGLDVVVDPDRTWCWKDEDDFAAFTDAPGYWTAAQAVAARAEGRRVIALAEEGKSPFDGTYCDFVPDPTWSLPELPTGWDIPPM